MTTQDQDSSSHSFRQWPRGRYGIRNTDECGTADRLAFPAQSSVLDEDALRERIACLYDLPRVVSCRFLTRGDSDVYVVATADDQRFFLKVYRPPHSLTVAEAEGQLTADLFARGFPAVAPVRRRDGKYATAVGASEGVRPILLWTEAPPLQPGKGAAVAEALGRTVGQLHNVTDSLPREYDLPVDTASSVASSIAELLPYGLVFMDERDANVALAAAEWGQERMATWPRESPAYGICHGDLGGVNIRSHPVHGITLFDFGASRYTWRTCDFMRFYPGGRSSPERQAYWDAFRAGYSAVETLPGRMDELFPTYRLIASVRGIGYNCASCRLRMGTESPEGFLPGDIESLREQVQDIPELRDHLDARGLL